MSAEPSKTELLRVDLLRPEPALIRRAADLLRKGGLVAFPTETVYGLGAVAFDPAAVARIFEAKGRPAVNPIIVHVSDARAATELVTRWPPAADKLAERFWPGPLTLVLPKSSRVPDIVTAGRNTVALRVPAHRVAAELLAAADMPIAAPSANRSSQLSPTRAEHVLRDLDGRTDMLLDAGPTSGGLESTVIDLSTDKPRLLRPGLIAPGQIESAIGPIDRVVPTGADAGGLASPGLLPRHYAPRAALVCAPDEGKAAVDELLAAGHRVGWLVFGYPHVLPRDDLEVVVMPTKAVAYASQLYAVLHALDDARVDQIVVAIPPESEDWLAIRDRLTRASR